MAQVKQHATVLDEHYASTMRFRIKGARCVGDEEFELDGVRELRLDTNALEEVLERAGIPRDETLMYTERFYRMVQTSELARLIAERMDRIG